MDIKRIIADSIKVKYEGIDLYDLIIESISADKGDFSLPCFAISKQRRTNPMLIAEEVKSSVSDFSLIDHIEVLSGYVNFFLKKDEMSRLIVDGFRPSDLSPRLGQGKVVCIDYASPNLAKCLHIGHLKTTIIGESLARIFEQCGYEVKRLNYVGDYGTPFGKIIYGLQHWSSMAEVKERGNDALQDYYIRFCASEKDDPALSQEARDIFRKIESKDAEIYPLYQYIVDIALKEATGIFNLLGVSFDDYRGEMYFSQFVPQNVKMLEEKGLLKTSEGAKIVDLEPYDLTPAMIIKSDGTSTYTSRDISAVIERKREYNFSKMLYVTDVAQTLNFKQLFKVMELAGYDFYQDMEHIYYGRFSLPDGKISSRRGKQAVLTDLMDYALNKAKDVIKDRTFLIEKPDNVAEKVARAVLNYSVLKVERTKDCVFDMEKAFSFDGETAPYMLYTYTRIESVLRKADQNPKAKADYACFGTEAFDLVKQVNTFSDAILSSLEKRDPNFLAKRVMDMCKSFNKFYTADKILDGNPTTTQAKLNLVSALHECLKTGFHLLCIDTLQEM